jgi:hypothetical protein
MIELDDETLMAYADAELSVKEQEKVETALKGNAEARARLKEFSDTATALAPYAEITKEPVPKHLEDLVRNHRATAEVIQFPRLKSARHWMAIAASLVIGIALGSGSMKYYSGDADKDGNIVYRGASKFPSPTESKIGGTSKLLANYKSEIETLLAEMPKDALSLEGQTGRMEIDLGNDVILTLITSFVSDIKSKDKMTTSCIVAELSEPRRDLPVLLIACGNADGSWHVAANYAPSKKLI